MSVCRSLLLFRSELWTDERAKEDRGLHEVADPLQRLARLDWRSRGGLHSRVALLDHHGSVLGQPAPSGGRGEVKGGNLDLAKSWHSQIRVEDVCRFYRPAQYFNYNL